MISMQQPDPAGLFEKYQGQRRNPPANNSVTAQISQRPQPPDSIPTVNQPAPPHPEANSQQPIDSQPPENPFVALYESGVMEQAIEQAQPAANPFVSLYESGLMTQSVLDAEDKQYRQDLKNWEKQKREYIPYRGMGQSAFPKEPEAPARPIEQIEQDWNLGVKVLRGQELGNILHRIESGQMTPDQDAIVARHLEPELTPEIRKQLQVSRLTRDKFLELQQQAIEEQQQSEAFGKESLYMSPGQIASDPRFGSQSERANVFGRSVAKGLTLNYAFSPDKDKLNSENAEEQAEERAQRLFYQDQEADYPFTALGGNILGAMAPIGATGMAIRGARTALAGRALASGPPTAATARVIASRGAPTTAEGILAESAATGLPYDILSRPEGSEAMNLKENLFARGQNIGFGLATGLGFDLGLMGMGKAWRKLKQMPGDVVNKAEVKRRGKLLDDLAEKNNYENADDMLDDLFLTTVRDESGERLRMQTEILDVLPEFKELSDRVPQTQAAPETPQTAPPPGRETPARTEEPAPTTERPATGEAEAAVQGRAEPAVTAYPDRDTAITNLGLQTFTPTSNKHYSFDSFEANELPLINKLLNKLREKNVSPDKAAGTVRRWLHNRGIAVNFRTTNRFSNILEEAYISGKPVKLYENAPKQKTTTKVVEAEAPTEHKVTGSEIVEAPIDELTLSTDVPQFKSGADQQGVVEPLGGAFDRTGVGPIQIWVRNDGSKEVISGRHRLDLARRSGEKTIPAQYHYESQGFDVKKASTLDAMLNIREGQGKVRDYVDYFKATRLTKAEADAEGILARATGKRAYTIATSGSDTLIAAHRASQLTDEAATRIASAAPNNEALQAVGIKAIQDGKTITVAENMVKAVRTMTDESAMRPGGDMFGFDDSALKEAEALARKAAAKQADIQKTLSAVQGAAKNPERAAKEGVDVKDPEAVKRRIDELKQEKQDWQNWHTNPELTAQLRGEAVTPPPKASEPPKPPDQQEGFDLTPQTEAELSARAKSQQQAEAAELKQQQDLEAKARADEEAKDFELGIQGSGADVSARQSDLLGLGTGAQHKQQRSVKSEAEPSAKTPETKAEAPKKLSFNQKNGQVELDGKTLTKGRKKDLQDAIREGIASGNLPGKLKDYRLDKPEGKRRWIAEYRPTEQRVKAEELTKPYDELNTNEYYSFLESLTEAEQKVLRKKLNLSDKTDLEQLVGKLESFPVKEKNDYLKPVYEERLNKPPETKKESKYQTITNNPDPKAKDLKGGPYTLDYHNKIIRTLKAEELSVDDFKAAFRTLIDNKEEILARLNKYKKNNLMAISRRHAAKKADAVDNAFEYLRNTFLLDKEIPPLTYDPFMIGKGAKTYKQAEAVQSKKITELVESLTQKDLDSYAKKYKQRLAEAKKTQAETKARIENPQKLEDYQLAIRENGKESLTKAQTAEYERLTTEADWHAREARQQKKNIVKGLETEEALEIQPITEGTHSKTGDTIYNVKVETKLGKQKFQEAAQQARTMKGGYYRGNFWLKTQEEAEQFVHWLNGQTIDRTPAKMAQETGQATKQVDKLRTMADKLEEQGTAELNAERTTNTARQMDQAASARGKATKKVSFARTLKNIANGIEDGSIRFLSKLSNMTQLDTLNSLKRQAVPESLMDSSYNGYSINRQMKEGVTLEDYIDKIKIPEVVLHRDMAAKLAEQLKGKKGFARLRHELDKQISVAIRSDKNTISMNPHSEYAGLLDSFVKKYDADPGWLYKQNMEDIKRLQRMGITSDEHLRSAIRELETVRSSEGVKTPKERKLDDMRFKIKQGLKSFNDFFPTPEDVVNRVLELSDIRPGMKTLEPNAGMGHIAKKLQAAAGKENVDLVEMSGQLVDYLKASGHDVKQSDFLKFGKKGTYDRIVMNPPFSKDQDIDHVMHAYELLKPGGKMTAIMSNMAGLRTNKKNQAFSGWLDEVGAHVEDLEAGAFKSSFNPTSVNTKVVVIEKPLKAASSKAKAATSARDEMLQRMKEIEKRRAAGETLEVTATRTERKPLDIEQYRIGSDRTIDELREMANKFEGQADGKSLKPLAMDMAEFTIKNGKRLEKADMAELARKHGVSEEVVNAISTQPFTYDYVKYRSELGNTDASDFLMKHFIENQNRSKTSVSVKDQDIAGVSLYSSPVVPAARKVADMLHLNPAASASGAVYGGITGGSESEAEVYSPQWWLDSAFGAAAGAVAGAAGISGIKSIPVRGKSILSKHSHAMDAYDFIGRQVRKLSGMSRGNEEVSEMGKRQQLMKALIERQSEKAGEYLLKNFTPSERATMADLIEGRGIVADGNLLHRQAKELDDFIGYTSKKLQELGMLDADIEPGGYLHRYYSKDLGIGGSARALTPKGKTLSGSWSIRRGTQEVFDDKYMSKSMRDTMAQVRELQTEYNKLRKKSGDLVGADTQGRMGDIKAELKDLQSIEFREYLMPENGTMKSYFMAADEVPVIPGLKRTSIGQASDKASLNQPGRQGRFRSMDSKGIGGSTDKTILTDRRWTIDGMKGQGEGILHRDWTKAERDSWGEINDAAYRMVRGQSEVAHDLSLGTFYKEVDDRFNGTKVSDKEIEGWHKVPDTAVGKGSRMKKYGALSGKYVTDDIWQAIRNHGRNPLSNLFNNHPAVSTYLKTLGKWKAYKTVYNPVSHMNNTIGNLQMYYLSDYEARHLADSFKELRKGEASEFVREARNNGLFGNDWTSEVTGKTGKRNIDELLEKLRNQPEIPDFEQSLDSVMQIKQWFIESSNAVREAKGVWKTGAELAKTVGNPLINTARKPIDKAANAMQAAYRMEDEFFKLAIYMAERQKGTKPAEAVQAANRYFFDYNDMPDAMKLVRDFPIGSPFISYTYFAIPAVVKTAIEKPEKILSLAAALEGINYASMHLNGELQEQGYWERMADEKELYPSWMQGRSLFGSLNNISVPFLESYKLGLANANVGGNPFVGNAERSGAWPEFMSFWGAGPEGSNPVTKLIFDISRNEDWRGNPIWSEGAPTSEQVRKGLNYIYQNVTPSNPLFPGSYHQQKLIEGMANEVRESTESGEQPNALMSSVVDLANATSDILGGGQFTGLDRRENEILFRDALFGSVGMKLRPVRADQLEESKTFELRKKTDNLKKWIRTRERLFDENRISERQIRKDRNFLEQQFKKLSDESVKISESASRQIR